MSTFILFFATHEAYQKSVLPASSRHTATDWNRKRNEQQHQRHDEPPTKIKRGVG
jgi:hypothetical protein